MKNLVLLGVVTVALAFTGSQAVAASAPFPTLTMSGTVETVKTNVETKTGDTQTTQSKSFNNATIYLMISNAVAQGYVTGVPPTNLPAKGFIVFNPEGSDAYNNGVFFVTNKSPAFSFPLSGLDGNGDYYSYIELDTDSDLGQLGFDLGLSNVSDDFNSVAAFNDVANSETTTSTAVFYVHSDPYAYDAADIWAGLNGFGNDGPDSINSPNPYPTQNNSQFSLEAQGVLTIAEKSNSGSGSFTGSGNALVGGNQGVITSFKVTVK